MISLIYKLEGKVALITGGASGIGESTTRHFFKHGAKVVIADVQDHSAHSICNDLNSSSASFINCDVTKEKDVENAVNAAVSRYGKLDIMFNNAGILGMIKTNILDVTPHEFEEVIKVNLLGVFLGTKHAARVMIPARQGSIISTASICGIIGGFASHAYISAKQGVLGLMRNTAIELGQHGIRVNCISPYAVATEMTRKFLEMDNDGLPIVYSNLKGAALRPQDIAEAALYLGSDESKYVSGHNLVVDGGFTIMNTGFNMYDNLSN